MVKPAQVWLSQPEFHRVNPGKDPLNARGLKSEDPPEQASEHGAVVGQHRVVAVLKERGLRDLDLLAGDAATIDAAAHHPIDAAVTMIGAAVAVLAEGAAELGNNDDDGVAPRRRSDLFREAGERPAEFAQPVGEVAGRGALVDVGIPAAD